MSTEAFQPARILNQGSTQEKAEGARLSNFIGAIALSDLISTTLGPKGMDKILQSPSNLLDSTITNDGATILGSIQISNAAAKILIEISKVQDDEIGDGTTSVVVLAGELLKEAEKLIHKRIHPQTIIKGFRLAKDIALKKLRSVSQDYSENQEELKKYLKKIAMTIFSTKILTPYKSLFADLAVDSILRLKGSTNLESIQILKKTGGLLKESYIEEGFVLDKKIGVGQPKRIENAKILVANTSMDYDKIKIFGSRVVVNSSSKLAEIEEEEKKKMLRKCQKIVDHGINVFINRQLIYNLPEQFFTDNGVMSIEHADFAGIERLSLVTGGEIVSTFDHPELVTLGTAKLIEEIMIGEDKLIRFSGCKEPSACTIILRGSSKQILDEAERSLHDGLAVLSQMVKNPKIVLGAGCTEIIMAQAIEEAAKETSGKIQIAMESFARALTRIPTIIANNAGYDAEQLVSELKTKHYKGNNTFGIDVMGGKVCDVQKIGVFESLLVKEGMLLKASEATEMILRVDTIMNSAPRRRGMN
ncbi:t-complex protein 1 subunit beta [Anaeramoeba flamelloides]|uniref:CCT-beta n=1 Tax=Anaeramoeba flamelloides TaxID=1746091 RepID=A0ABQ8YZH5_9EUKA|nr:t-complex protein 1 subunit beta [Anaeramoeba flamelloides]